MSQSYFAGEAIFSSGGVLFDAKSQKIYLVQKKETDEWLLPKGHMDEGETIEEAAKREIFEETGYASEVKNLLSVQIRPDIKEPNKSKVIFWFLVNLLDDVRATDTQMEDENFEGRWFSKEEAIKILRWDEDKRLISLCD